MPNVFPDWRDLPLAASRFFFLVSFLILGYAAWEAIRIPVQWHGRLRSASPIAIPHGGPAVLKPLDMSVGPFATHALFYVPKAAPAPVKGPGISELLAQYELTGIVQGIEPEELIQNRSTKETHFVQPGEEFGPLTLVAINTHRVVVEYGGEEGELRIQEGT